MQHELVERPIEQSGGWVEALDRPGLGIDVIDAVVEKYRF